MRGSPHLPPVVLGLLFLACGPAQPTASSAGTSLALSSGSGSVSSQAQTSGQQIFVPEFVYPEDQLLSAHRDLQVRNSSGVLERMQEVLLADGQGHSRLDVIQYSPGLMQPYQSPSSQLVLNYENRMRFLIRYRDAHLGARAALLQNYRWTEDPVHVQVAGVDCVRYTAQSKHDMGDVEFLADAQTGLLLGWTFFANNGQILLKLETTQLNFAPNLTGVVWSSPLVGDQPYVDPADRALLGYTPRFPQYLPPGFYRQESWLRFSAGFYPGMSDMLVEIYSDGLHLVFVAQHEQTQMGQGLQFANKVVDVRQTDLGGIRLAEGDLGNRRLYVSSMLSMVEIQTIFGSLLD